MMKHLRNRDGFTLMELLVTIVAGSLVTLAATTVLLLGLRMNRHSLDTVKQQNTTRIVLSLLEDMASDSSIQKLVSNADAWFVCGSKISEQTETNKRIVVDNVLVAFDSGERQIYTGGTVTTTIEYNADETLVSKTYQYTAGTPILEEVNASFAELSKDQLLTFSIETEEGTYSSSTYCRMAPEMDTEDQVIDKWEEDPDSAVEEEVEKDGEISDDISTVKARAEFLKVATSQLGSPGLILEKIPVKDEREFIYISVGEYYSHWYNQNWEPETPWCAIFIMWCLSNHPEGRDRWMIPGEPELLKTLLDTEVAIVHVDSLIEYLNGNYKAEAIENGAANDVVGWYPSDLKFADGKAYTENAYENPLPGDLIFFDWVADGIQDCDHVGIVLTVTNGYVYTVEGNTANTVAVRKYKTDDPRIMGYGVLDWRTDKNFSPDNGTEN